MKIVLHKVIPFINTHILGSIPAFSQIYAIITNLPIISISVKSKGLTEKSSSEKLFLSSKYILWALSWLSTTFRTEVSILAQLPNTENQLTQLYQLSWKLKVLQESWPLQSCSFHRSIDAHILIPIPAFYDLPSQSYKFTQL